MTFNHFQEMVPERPEVGPRDTETTALPSGGGLGAERALPTGCSPEQGSVSQAQSLGSHGDFPVRGQEHSARSISAADGDSAFRPAL